MKLDLILLCLLCITYCSVDSSAKIKIPIRKRVSDINIRTSKQSINRESNPNNINTLMNGFYYNQTMQNFENIQYLGDIVVGSKDQVFTVVFDTGSDVLWLPSVGCSPCHNSDRFSCGSSDTCQSTTTVNQRAYGTGDIMGYNANDMIGLSSESKVNYPFILVQEDSGLDGFQGAGILGLNNDNSQKNFVDLAFDSNLIEEKVFSFYMDYDPYYNAQSSGSYMTAGYIPEQHIDNAIWLSATESNYWSTDVIAMEVNGEDISFKNDPDIHAVLFDTGTSYMLVSNNVYTTFYAKLLASGCFGSDLMCPCSTPATDYENYPNITFYTRGAKFVVTPYHYLLPTIYVTSKNVNLCSVAVQSTSLPTGSTQRQILGDSFLRYNFVGFSKGNQSMALSAEHMYKLKPIDYRYTFWTGVVSVILMVLALIIVHRKKHPEFEKAQQLQFRRIQRGDHYYQVD